MDDVKAEVVRNAETRHDERCANGKDCAGRAWHVRNDYLRHEVLAMRARKHEEYAATIGVLEAMLR